jgi:hypothetical protein
VPFRIAALGCAGILARPARLIALATVASSGAALPAFAQTSHNFLPPNVFTQVPPGAPIPRVLPPQFPSVAPGTLVPPPAEPGGAVPEAAVAVEHVVVEGVTVYPEAEMAKDVAGLVGPP